MENMMTAEEAAEYLTTKFGWPVSVSDISVMAHSSHYAVRVVKARPKRLYPREDIENVVLESPHSISQCRKPFWPRGGELQPSATYYYNTARKMS